jgi:DNA helicase II / ATP-dependent DNA helicase PcrA
MNDLKTEKSLLYHTDIDYAYLNKLEFNELAEYAQKNFCEAYMYDKNNPLAYKRSISTRLKIVKLFCTRLGLQPSNEQYLFSVCSTRRVLCEAIAGAGKTSFLLLRLLDTIINIDVPGFQVLAVAYNSHAADDLRQRYLELAGIINSSIISLANRPAVTSPANVGFRVPTDVRIMTFHSWCLSWVTEYANRFGIGNVQNFTISNDQAMRLMNVAVKQSKNSLSGDIFITDKIISALLSVYSYMQETMTFADPQAWDGSSSRINLNDFTLSDLQLIFSNYTKDKQYAHKLDFGDYLLYMVKLCENPEINKRIRSCSRIYMFDEFQDLTPVMLRVIQLIIKGDESLGIPEYSDSMLTCIGDGDQSIYNFRGTDSDNCLRFRPTYSIPGTEDDKESNIVRILSMSLNRRCRTEICKVSSGIITSVEKRIIKPIKALRPGGIVDTLYYTSVEQELSQLIAKLKQLPIEELCNTCVFYRNLNSSRYLTFALVEANIPFRIGSGHEFLSDMYSQSILSALDLLSVPDSTVYIDNAMYRMVPKSAKHSKAQITQMCKNEELCRKARKGIHMFWEMDWGEWTEISGFNEALATLKSCCVKQRRGTLMSQYMPPLLKLIRLYYSNYQNIRAQKTNTALSDELLTKTDKYFTRDISYEAFVNENSKVMKYLKDSEGSQGVYITTMHGLKGLEFNNVYGIDFEDSIFPGSDLAGSEKCPASYQTSLEMGARRLLYVAVTRAKNYLCLFFSKREPSRYIRFFTNSEEIDKIYSHMSNQTNSSTRVNLSGIDDNNEPESSDFILADDMPESDESIETKPEIKSESTTERFKDSIDSEFMQGIIPDEAVSKEEIPDDSKSAEQDFFGSIEIPEVKQQKVFSEEELETIQDANRDKILSQSINSDNLNDLKDKPQTKGILEYILSNSGGESDE